jgi:hypothetical protein
MRHLSADAEFAEDLAIRYADTHFGRRNPSEEYGAERDRCMAKLFGEIAKEHSVPVEQVSSSLGRNRAYIDVAEILPFARSTTISVIGKTRLFAISTLSLNSSASGKRLPNLTSRHCCLLCAPRWDCRCPSRQLAKCWRLCSDAFLLLSRIEGPVGHSFIRVAG